MASNSPDESHSVDEDHVGAECFCLEQPICIRRTNRSFFESFLEFAICKSYFGRLGKRETMNLASHRGNAIVIDRKRWQRRIDPRSYIR